MHSPFIKLYALSTCVHCKRTKQLLADRGVTYEGVDVDLCPAEERASVLEEVTKLNPSRSFPTLRIGDRVIVGYQEKAILEALEALGS